MPRKAEAKEPELPVPPEERCMNRITAEKTNQLFGDGIHRFFLEQRCTNRREPGSLRCLPCSQPNLSKKHYTRTFPKGLVSEPIPPNVQMFDSEWYHQSVKKWGEPRQDAVNIARDFQRVARLSVMESRKQEPDRVASLSVMESRKQEPDRVASLSVMESRKQEPDRVASQGLSPVEVVSKVADPVSPQMPSTTAYPLAILPVVKKTRKPRMAKTDPQPDPASPEEPDPLHQEAVTVVAAVAATAVPKQKRGRKPHMPPTPLSPMEYDEKSPMTELPPPPRPAPSTPPPTKRAVKRMTKPKKKEEPSIHPQQITHRESCIPTHLEEEIEEYSIGDYESVTVTLTLFNLDGVIYLRDASKNKLYRRLKEKTIGPYVGRYNPVTSVIETDVPDSDDEDDSV